MKLDVTVPKLIYAGDYHEFSYLENLFQTLNPDIKCSEVGFAYSHKEYVGVVYVGSYPEDNDLKLLLDEDGVVFEEQ